MKIVLVKWKDSIVFGHWAPADEVDQSSFKICYASGFLITQNDVLVTVALLSSDDKYSFSNWINIPAENVMELTVVGEVDWGENDGS